MIPNFLYCLILCQLRTYKIINRIVNSSNNLCIVCFLGIYQSIITLISISKYHISSTNISPHLFTIKKISHHITPIRTILSIHPHTHRLKWIVSFSSHNQQTKKKHNANIKLQKLKGRWNTKLQILNKYLLEVIRSFQIFMKVVYEIKSRFMKPYSDIMLNNPN